jgi:hypothetical protein
VLIEADVLLKLLTVLGRIRYRKRARLSGPLVTSESDLRHYLPQQQMRTIDHGGETCHV